ncbi:phospholipid carrier-dependent glycosyltransferase [Lentisphaerota bacterium WC36G]|nr:phospholipid carrier-dependent glycosyltransferase [Lentisphaerae bacterium WC36]
MIKYLKKNGNFALYLILFCVIAYLATLGYRGLISPDETRYAEIPREMLLTGDWITPKMNDLVFFEKPIFAYWLSAVNMLIFGVNAFAARLGSALMTLIATCGVWFFVKKTFKNDFLSVLSAAIFASMGIVFGIGTFVVLDAQFSGFMTLGMIFFYMLYKSKGKMDFFTYSVLCGLSFGCAFLTKGFVIFILAGGAATLFLLWEKEYKKIFTLPWLPFFVMLLVAVPWSLAMLKADAGFWHHFIIEEHIGRFLSKFRENSNDASNKHEEPFWFFIPVVLIGILPWGIHLWTIIKGVAKKDFSDSRIRFLICWFGVVVVFFSLSSGKLPTYILPCFAPLAMLVGYWLNKSLNENNIKTFNIVNKILLVLFSIAAVAATVYTGTVLTNFCPTIYGKGELFKYPMIILVFALCVTFLYLCVKNSDVHEKLKYFFIAFAVIFMVANLAAPNKFLYNKAQGQFILENAQEIPEDATVIAYSNMIFAVNYYLERKDIGIYARMGNFGYALNRDQKLKEKRFYSVEKLEKLIADKSRTKKIVLFRSIKEKRLDSKLPKGYIKMIRTGDLTMAIY